MTPLYPQQNAFRQRTDLSGFWDFCLDPEDSGSARGFPGGLTARAESVRPVAVPGSYNEQLAEARDYLGPVWYEARFDLPWGWAGQRVFVRFGSVNYHATVWLNGERLGEHEGGHLPFVFELTSALKKTGNVLVVRAENELRTDRVPPGNVPDGPSDGFMKPYPAGAFDFFPYAGIQRPVLLFTLPESAITDVTVTTALDGAAARVRVAVDAESAELVHARISGFGADVRVESRLAGGRAELEFVLSQAKPWEPGAPHLYRLDVELSRSGKVFDQVSLDIGVRTVAIDGDRLLLNGKPVYLRGFGRHEDFPVLGRAMIPGVIIKDYEMLQWIGANSFRTTHYPYSDEMMDLADRLGFLVIDETPAVGLFFAEEGLARRLELCKRATRELVLRDKNRPSVIAWSLANEPHSHRPAAHDFFRELVRFTRDLDTTRLVTLVSYVGEREEVFDECDLVCVNRYYGWYTHSGRIAEGAAALSAELDRLHARFGKPIVLSEFGADAVPGLHAEPAEMFAEEYQTELISEYLRVLRSKPYVVGEHVWNLCDFKTGQAVHRVGGLNYKGVFTRDRRPKHAARALKALWRDEG